MKKNILIITGAGASKSLNEKLPLGQELVSKHIAAYHEKVILWLIGYFCAILFQDNIDDVFLEFVKFCQEIKNKLQEIYYSERVEKYRVWDDYQSVLNNKLKIFKQNYKKTIFGNNKFFANWVKHSNFLKKKLTTLLPSKFITKQLWRYVQISYFLSF